MPILTDMHIHSHFSPDSKASIAECCEAAIAKGFERICITDHLELKDEYYDFYDAEGYFESIEHARKNYGITLLTGCEIDGGPYNYPERYQACLARPYDYILCSVHDWYEGIFADKMAGHPMPLEESFGLYWDEIYKTVCYGGFDALAHMDFPKRYYNKAAYEWKKIEKIFAEMIRKGIALEINTSSLRVGSSKETMPGPELLDFYKKCGGRLIVLGSDAHNTEIIGEGFDVAEDLTKGLDLVWYQGRSLMPLNLT